MSIGNNDKFQQANEPQSISASETIVLRPCMRSYWGLWIVFLLLFPVGVFITESLNASGAPSLLEGGARVVAWIPILVLLVIFWRKYNVRYVLKDDLIASVTGILSLKRNYSSTQYSSIRGVNARQSIIGMLLNFADVAVGTSETNEQEIVMRGISSPHKVVELCYSRMPRAKK